MTRVSVRRGVNAHAWLFGIRIGVELYDGPVLTLALDACSWWIDVRCRLWYSEAMLYWSWDRWEAERLAGEHAGITIRESEGT